MPSEHACTICGQVEPNAIDLYTRKSKRLKKDDHRREQSTDAQREQGHRWAHRNGYAVRKVWKDIQSAFKDVKRSDFDRALRALAQAEVPALWAYAIDRFSRKGAEDLLKVIGKARVIFDMDGLDSNESRDRRWIINRAEEAREYSEQLSQRVCDTKAEQRDKGLWVAGRPPWGYKVTRDRYLYPDDTPAAEGFMSRAEVVREIFRRVAEEGASTRDIVRWLDGAGVPGPGGKGWRYGYVSRMLRHPAYVGWQMIQVKAKPTVYRDDSGHRVRLVGKDGGPVALVSEERQRKALATLQGLIVQRTIPPCTPTRNTRPRHLLTGLTRCGGCEHSMPFQGRSYQCAAVIGGRNCPARAGVRGDQIEEYVFQRWLARLTNAELDDPIMLAVSERWAARVKPEETEEEQAARAVLRAAEADLKRLLDDRQAGVYDGPAARYFGPMLKDATAAVESAREGVARYSADGPLNLPFASLDRDELIAAWEAVDLPMKRDLLRLAINRVTIVKARAQGVKFDGDARVTIEWAEPAESTDREGQEAMAMAA
ncbi:recombinase family protein [Streptomyces sp. PT12]|uniref:recombinase family protein n=1 Tax=Streptomyces sp. PT12 TaxID=1510197 RepID=UPI0011BE6E52|nr:recombinase family protein [Streptomyces sp. PT12]